ncbi:hypothetical protein CDD83_4012 [Cordyceps sp. RAO-2017]|nr:hypothetical protein CDD83_4012 [Cordyceps sp. RAO-2017]
MRRYLRMASRVTVRRVAGKLANAMGRMSDTSSYGPTWDLDIKPDVGAPADLVMVPNLHHDYQPELGKSTAVPQAASGRFFSVAGQGGGLVQARDAPVCNTVVDPPALAFNDSEHRVSSFRLRIANLGPSEVEYRLSNVPPEATHDFPSGTFNLTRGTPIPFISIMPLEICSTGVSNDWLPTTSRCVRESLIADVWDV